LRRITINLAIDRRRVGRVEFLRIEDLPEEELKVGSFEDELLRSLTPLVIRMEITGCCD